MPYMALIFDLKAFRDIHDLHNNNNINISITWFMYKWVVTHF